jgi:hypothetical protein
MTKTEQGRKAYQEAYFKAGDLTHDVEKAVEAKCPPETVEVLRAEAQKAWAEVQRLAKELAKVYRTDV